MQMLRRSLSGAKLLAMSAISGNGLANTVQSDLSAASIESEEEGFWTYLVIDGRGITVRQAPAYDRSFKSGGRRLEEGTLVQVDRRLTRGWTRWLRVRGSGEWVFDVSPKDAQIRMVEVACEVGPWEHVVHASTPVLRAPSLREASAAQKPRRSGPTLEHGEKVTVIEKYSPVGRTDAFLKLMGGSGWVHCPSGWFANASHDVREASSPSQPHTKHAPVHYMVIDRAGVDVWRLDHKGEAQGAAVRRLLEGEVCEVTESRATTQGFMLRFGDGLWGADHAQRVGGIFRSMVPVSIERGGHWIYKVVGLELDLRTPSSFARTSAENIMKPCLGDSMEVTERAACGSMRFLRLADGRGWIFDKGGATKEVSEWKGKLWTGRYRGKQVGQKANSNDCAPTFERCGRDAPSLGQESMEGTFELEVS